MNVIGAVNYAIQLILSDWVNDPNYARLILKNRSFNHFDHIDIKTIMKKALET